MKYTRSLLGQYNLNRCELVMKTVEPDSTNTAPERMTKFIDIIYVKADLEEVADNSTQMNY